MVWVSMGKWGLISNYMVYNQIPWFDSLYLYKFLRSPNGLDHGVLIVGYGVGEYGEGKGILVLCGFVINSGAIHQSVR